MKANVNVDRMLIFRARLHQASASTLQQLCIDTSDTVLTEINGDTPEPIFSDSIVFKGNSITSIKERI